MCESRGDGEGREGLGGGKLKKKKISERKL